MRIIVVNDIHSNSSSLLEFCNVIEGFSFDKIVFLGDLLTYGVDVTETIGLMRFLNKRYDCVFIKGNHDQIYFDAQNNKDYEYKPFPSFIKESIENNLESLDCNLESLFPWCESYIENGVYFSHANTFSYGDWSYLNTEEEFEENLNNLDCVNCYVGVFGHTHRSKYKISNCESSMSLKLDLFPGSGSLIISKSSRAIITNGSLGQPRNSNSSFLICDISSNEVEITSIPVNYDIERHRNNIVKSNVSIETKEKLLSYYR